MVIRIRERWSEKSSDERQARLADMGIHSHERQSAQFECNSHLQQRVANNNIATFHSKLANCTFKQCSVCCELFPTMNPGAITNQNFTLLKIIWILG